MPATFEQADDEMMARFNTAWLAGSESSSIPVAWPNRRFDIDSVRQGDTGQAAAWVRFTTQHVTGSRRAIGGNLWRNRGLITVEIYVPGEQGNSLHRKLCRIAADAFRNQTTDSGVAFFNTRLREIGNDGPWYRVDVLTDFQYSEAIT